MPCMSSSFRLNEVVNFYPVYSPTDSTWSNKRRCLTFSIFENIFIFYRFGPCCRRHHSRKSRRWSILLAARPQSWTCWTRWRLWRRRSKSGMSTVKKHNFVNLFTDFLARKSRKAFFEKYFTYRRAQLFSSRLRVGHMVRQAPASLLICHFITSCRRHARRRRSISRQRRQRRDILCQSTGKS